MKVVLLREVQGLGGPGSVVDVADGYARNYLIPRKLCMKASQGAVKFAEQLKVASERRERKAVEEAQQIASALSQKAVEIKRRVGRGDRIFGSVTAIDIAEAVSQQLGVEIDRRRIELEEPLRSLGEHTVKVRLHPQVEAELTVVVSPETT